MAVRLTEKERNIQQVSFRFHMNDFKLMKKLLFDDGLQMQQFMNLCVQAYLHGDPLIVKVIKSYRELEEVPKEYREKYSLSQRERQALLDELEQAEKDNPLPKYKPK